MSRFRFGLDPRPGPRLDGDPFGLMCLAAFVVAMVVLGALIFADSGRL